MCRWILKSTTDSNTGWGQVESDDEDKQLEKAIEAAQLDSVAFLVKQEASVMEDLYVGARVIVRLGSKRFNGTIRTENPNGTFDVSLVREINGKKTAEVPPSTTEQDGEHTARHLPEVKKNLTRKQVRLEYPPGAAVEVRELKAEVEADGTETPAEEGRIGSITSDAKDGNYMVYFDDSEKTVPIHYDVLKKPYK